MSKVLFTAVALAASVSSSITLAQKMDGMKGMDMGKEHAASAPMAMTHHATGVVKKLDPKAGVVSVEHEPVKSLNWPAMTMGFHVTDKGLLDKFAVGKKVEFDFEQKSQGYVVTAVK